MKKSFAILAASLAIAACCNNTPKGIVIERQGVFSSGGTVTATIPGDYDPTQNWMDATRKGTTTHVDHANTFYQIPADGNGNPIVFLHGYGQTRTGWQATPDGREGWSDIFLRKGYGVFLVDQPRRGAAGATEFIVNDPGDVDGDKFKVGEQAWYTHFRIGRVAPERYKGSQFPEGAEAQNQFFCQMTPNTGNYDEALFGSVMSDVLADVKALTGKKSIYLTHSQGGRVGWATDVENIAAVVAVEPGFGPISCALPETAKSITTARLSPSGRRTAPSSAQRSWWVRSGHRPISGPKSFISTLYSLKRPRPTTITACVVRSLWRRTR